MTTLEDIERHFEDRDDLTYNQKLSACCQAQKVLKAFGHFDGPDYLERLHLSAVALEERQRNKKWYQFWI